MPIANGRLGGGIGAGGILAMPGKRIGAPQSSTDLTASDTRPFRSAPFSTSHVAIWGVTRDSTGTPIGNCNLALFRQNFALMAWFDPFPRLALQQEGLIYTTSDASGNYIFYPSIAGPFFIVAYKAGAPDVAGTTVNSLQPVPFVG